MKLVNGSSKSSEMNTIPLAVPSLRLPFNSSIGISFTNGLLLLAITTCSPFKTLSINSKHRTVKVRWASLASTPRTFAPINPSATGQVNRFTWPVAQRQPPISSSGRNTKLVTSIWLTIHPFFTARIPGT